MTVEETIQAALIGSAAITALVPATRIRTPDANAQDLERPYIMHFPVGLEPNHMHDEIATIRHWRFYQVSCFDNTYTKCKAVAEAVKTLMAHANLSGTVDGVSFAGVQTFLRGERNFVEEDVRVHHIALDFEVVEGV